MAKEIQCPGNELYSLVAALRQIFFPIPLMSREEYRAFLAKNFEQMNESDFKRSYKYYEKCYSRRVQLADAISGSNKTNEITENLTYHLGQCFPCRRTYVMEILRRGVESEINLLKGNGKLPNAREIGREGLEAYFLGLIMKEDSRLLGLLKQRE